MFRKRPSLERVTIPSFFFFSTTRESVVASEKQCNWSPHSHAMLFSLQAAAEEELPAYRIEPAKSGRSKCGKCEKLIDKNGVRIGSLDLKNGSYTRWCHLSCWRVPSKVWLGIDESSIDEIETWGPLPDRQYHPLLFVRCSPLSLRVQGRSCSNLDE